MAKRDEQPFEALYQQLETTVEKLEKGGLPLEESISLYEQGMELAKRCQALLDSAELRITKLRESFEGAAVRDGTPAEEEEALPLDEEP